VPIEPLLRNNDPRLIALGAWEVQRRPDDSFIPMLQQLVERWNLTPGNGEEDRDAFDAMTVILDTLIRRNAIVSPAGVAAIVHGFPDQALILTSRLPGSDAEPLLLSWYQAGQKIDRTNVDAEGANGLMLARVAAMMLVKSHPQLIAASILADSAERLVVSVHDKDASGVARCLVGCPTQPNCAAESMDEPQPGWPHVYQYTLDEYMPESFHTVRAVAEPILIEAGDDHITYSRYEATVHTNFCYSPAPLNAVNRHHLLAEMLRTNDRQMPWAVQQSISLSWLDDHQFLTELAKQADQEESTLRTTVKMFYEKGLITKTQATTIRPRLTITVFDDRQAAEPANAALPPLPIKDSRTTIRMRASE
jgi:hypothetical protein